MSNAKKDQQTEELDFTDGIRDAAGKLYKYTDKERVFVRLYLTECKFNASAAAEKAGYTGAAGTLRVIACNLMKKPHIIAAINAAFEALAMPRYEIIYRLGDIARGSLEDVMNEDGELDLNLARERGTLGLLKKIKIKRTRKVVEQIDEDGPGAGINGLRADPRFEPDPEGEPEKVQIESSVFFEEITFEIHDPLRALEMIGKNGRLFVDRTEQTGADGKPLIPEGAQTLIYLPDNGRGDTSAEVLAASRKVSRKKTTRTSAEEIKDA